MESEYYAAATNITKLINNNTPNTFVYSRLTDFDDLDSSVVSAAVLWERVCIQSSIN